MKGLFQLQFTDGVYIWLQGLRHHVDDLAVHFPRGSTLAITRAMVGSLRDHVFSARSTTTPALVAEPWVASVATLWRVYVPLGIRFVLRKANQP